MKIARETYLATLRARHLAATKIQALHRMRQCQQRYQDILASIRMIQRGWRLYWWRKDREDATVKIQTWTRMIIARKSYLKIQQCRSTAATMIQKNWRSRICQEKYKSQRISVVVIQRSWRNFVFRKERSVAAVKIQRWFRNKRLEKLKEAENLLSQVVFIQTFWRFYRYRCQAREAAVKIQTWWRMAIQRRNLYRLLALRYESALTIQKHWRSLLSRRALQKKLEEQGSKELGEKIQEARLKVKEAKENASEDKKLCNRTSFALDFLYRGRDMAYVIKALTDLGNTVIFVD